MPVVDGAGAGAGAESGADSREISDAAAGDKALQQENINDYQVSSMLGASLQQMKVCKYVNIGWQGLRIPCFDSVWATGTGACKQQHSVPTSSRLTTATTQQQCCDPRSRRVYV